MFLLRLCFINEDAPVVGLSPRLNPCPSSWANVLLMKFETFIASALIVRELSLIVNDRKGQIPVGVYSPYHVSETEETVKVAAAPLDFVRFAGVAVAFHDASAESSGDCQVEL